MIIEKLNQYTHEQIISLKNDENDIRLILEQQPDITKLIDLKKNVINSECIISLVLNSNNNNDIKFLDFECLKDNIFVLESYNRKEKLVNINGISILKKLQKVVISDLYVKDLNIEELELLNELVEFKLLYNNLTQKQHKSLGNFKNLKKLTIKGLDTTLLDELPNVEELICYNLKNGTDMELKMPNLKSLSIIMSNKLNNLDFLLKIKNIERIKLYGISRVVEIPDLNNLQKLQEIDIMNMKRLAAIPKLNKTLYSLRIAGKIPLINVDSLINITPENLPELRRLTINLGSTQKVDIILSRFKKDNVNFLI